MRLHYSQQDFWRSSIAGLNIKMGELSAHAGLGPLHANAINQREIQPLVRDSKGYLVDFLDRRRGYQLDCLQPALLNRI